MLERMAGRRALADRTLGVAALSVSELVARTPRATRTPAASPGRFRALAARSCASSRITRRRGIAPVREWTEVTGAVYRRPGGLCCRVPEGMIHASHVVVATGPFHRPRIPRLSSGSVARSVLQIDPTRYRCPEDLPDGAVLVVSVAGRPAARSADELLRAGRTVFLSVSGHWRVPRRFRGKDVYWLAGHDGPLRPDDRKLPRAAVAAVDRRHRRERRLRRQRAPDGGRRHQGARTESSVRPTTRWPSQGTRTRPSTRPTPHSPASWPPPASSQPRTPTWALAEEEPYRVSRSCRPRSPTSSPSTCGARTSRRSSRRPATTTTTAGSVSPVLDAQRSAAAAARDHPGARALTPWACTGCTRSSPACCPASAATRTTSPNTPSHERAGDRVNDGVAPVVAAASILAAALHPEGAPRPATPRLPRLDEAQKYRAPGDKPGAA